jgi:hypothetical protein
MWITLPINASIKKQSKARCAAAPLLCGLGRNRETPPAIKYDSLADENERGRAEDLDSRTNLKKHRSVRSFPFPE